MKSIFSGVYRPTDNDFSKLWKDGLFIVDTNVLLNIYRYPDSASQELLKTLKTIQTRLWIPYHVALEFQNNRLKVIAEQKMKFHDVRKIAKNIVGHLDGEFRKMQLHDKHALIDPSKFIDDIEKSVAKFLSVLDDAEKKQINVNDADELWKKIDSLFDGRIGPKPTAEEIRQIDKRAIERFENSTPPEYMDWKNDGAHQSKFSYGDILYTRANGNLYIWEQMLSHLESEEIKFVVFLTDDDKADWWWKVESDGLKTLGPMPELLEEIRRGGFQREAQRFKQS